MQVWEYFKSNLGFERLFEQLRKKYISLGRYSGTVVLKNVSREESEDLSDFFGTTIKEGEDYKTSFSKIEKKLRESKFSDFTWEELFLGYFGKDIMTKKNGRNLEKQKEKEFFDDIILGLKEPYQTFFADILLEKGNLYQILRKRYRLNARELKRDVESIFEMIENLDEIVPVSLSVLASSSKSGNPHFLDFKEQTSVLFLKLFSRFCQEMEPVTTEEKIEFLASHGIYVDSFSNYVITYLLKSDIEYVNAFANFKEVLNLNLSNLFNIGKLDTDLKKVFIFENPSILSTIKGMNIPVIITSGNPNHVVYKVLERLSSSGNELYYNGDFDPEGLGIAMNLKKKFPNLKFFCYEEEDYFSSLSKRQISSSRLKKLDGIVEPDLEIIKKQILNFKCSGYQEKNISRIIEKIQILI